MNSSSCDANHKENLQKLIFSLACRCPATEQPNCPLGKVRKLTMRERYDWMLTQTEERLDAIYQEHHQCLSRQSQQSSLRKIKTFNLH